MKHGRANILSKRGRVISDWMRKNGFKTCEIKRAYISLGSQTLQGQKCIEQKLEFERKLDTHFVVICLLFQWNLFKTMRLCATFKFFNWKHKNNLPLRIILKGQRTKYKHILTIKNMSLSNKVYFLLRWIHSTIYLILCVMKIFYS